MAEYSRIWQVTRPSTVILVGLILTRVYHRDLIVGFIDQLYL